MTDRSIFIGLDPREMDAFQVCANSIKAHLSEDIPIIAVNLAGLQHIGLYQRPTEKRDGKLWDVISDAPMSTEFAISRFAVPLIAKTQWALFLDADFMLRTDIVHLFAEADARYAVQVVKHEHRPGETVKMDGQAQTSYEKKNWSSCCLFNLHHPAMKQFTAAKLNTWSGRALHQFKWLEDHEIGELSADWNHLVSVDAPNPDARGIHFTQGIPSMTGYADQEFADEWREWAAQTTAV